eukprot:TRINITY_DN24061_c0_g1_i1.p1 TRINITY_DN24061_c0_g1~~TRINITY_DN24061_c0_g1_i1.p1  ORF type:complete len:360 (-),score=46.63 TRINITY_DN24061_c0_g1_i1:127-1164(-)
MPVLRAPGAFKLLWFMLRLSAQHLVLFSLFQTSTLCINETSDSGLETSTTTGVGPTNTTTMTSKSATSMTSSSITVSSKTSSSMSSTTSTSSDTSTSTTSSTFNGTTTWTSVTDTNTTTRSSSTETSRTSSSTASSTQTTTCTTSSSSTSFSKTSTTTTPRPAIITGGLKFSVTPQDGFIADPNVPLALDKAVAYLGKVDPDLRYLRVVSPRQSSSGRLQLSKSEASLWLSEGSLWLRYHFEIPGDAAPPVSRASVAGALAYATTSELENEANRALAERCGQGMYVLTLVEHEGPLMDGVQVQTTLEPPSNASSGPSNAANASTRMRTWYCHLLIVVTLSVLTLL